MPGNVFALELALEKSDYKGSEIGFSHCSRKYFGDYQTFAPDPESDSFVSRLLWTISKRKFK